MNFFGANLDVYVLAALAIIFMVVSYRYGKSWLTAFILSFYPAYFLFDLVKDNFVHSTQPITVIGLFVVSFALIMYILRQTIHGGYSFSSAKRWVSSILLSLGAISQLALVYYHTLPQLGSLYKVSGTITHFFNGTVPYIVLALIPFVALFVAARD